MLLEESSQINALPAMSPSGMFQKLADQFSLKEDYEIYKRHSWDGIA
jgi:hypothetical protein